MEPELKLKTLNDYKHTSLKVLHRKLGEFFKNEKEITIDNIKQNVNKINAYKNLAKLKPLNKDQVYILDDKKANTKPAEECIINGRFFWEHACAGEATRLGLGTKYLLNPSNFKKEEVINLIRKEKENNGKSLSEEKKQELMQDMPEPNTLLPLTLGQRHMIQIIYDLTLLAKKNKLPKQEIIQKQEMLIILNKKTAQTIIKEWQTHNFYSFKEDNIYFMIQEDFHGITKNGDNTFHYDRSQESNKRLHNHGQMMMQKMHDNSIFHFKKSLLDNTYEKNTLSQDDYLSLLKKHKDMVSFNIEDVGYLTSSIDYPSLSKALQLGNLGYGMVMEIVGQNKAKPQSGGAAFYDPILNKNVMVESFMLDGITPEEITFLNKNFNHYPNPSITMQTLQKECLHMPIKIKTAENGKEYIYFEPVQGDMNFLVKTAFIMRKELKAISNWKSPATTPATLKAMKLQDKQIGFKELAQNLGFLN